MPNPSFTRAAAVVLASLGCFAKQCVADEIIVRLDQPVYVVSGPGDAVTAQVLIDGNADRQGLQPVSDGLFSAGLKILFDDRKATVDSKANVIVKRELDYFGFSAPALVSTTPSGEVSIHGNISQADVPLKVYQGSVLGSVRMTNRATAVDRYPLELDFSRDLGPNEDFFVDGKGITRDASIRFIPSEVVVAEAPAQGDLDGDGTVGVQDIDLLSDAVQTSINPGQYDLTGDNQVNYDDFQLLIEGPEYLNTWIGDADLDGQFTTTDFVTVFVAGLYETGSPASWNQGDWNGDGIFDTSDFVGAFVSGGYEAGPRPAVAAVPEPNSLILLAVGLLFLWRRRSLSI